MIITQKGITKGALDRIASETGMVIRHDWRQLGPSRIRFRLGLGPKRKDGTKLYQRRTANYAFQNRERKVDAVCWHGHAAFMLKLFEVYPEAVIRSAVDTWRGQTDFLKRHRDSAFRNIGCMGYPYQYNEACFCND